MHERYIRYYTNQIGGGNGGFYTDVQSFGPLYKAPKIYQRGRGIGGCFGGVFRFLKPLFTSTIQFFRDEFLKTGSDLIHGIAEQKPMRDIIRDRSLEIVDKIRDKASDKIKAMSGSGMKRKIHNKIIKRPRNGYDHQYAANSKRAKKLKHKKSKTRNKNNSELDIFY